MGFRASPKKGNVVVELEEGQQLPPIPVSSLLLKKILVPTDFSECSEKAFRYAIALARQFQSQIVLAHVIQAFYPPPELLVLDAPALETRVREEAQKRLATWKKSVSELQLRTVLLNGVPEREINQLADEDNIDLIVIGTHGRSGMSHFLLGSTAERVLRHAPCPVLVVREREHEFLAEAAEISRGTSIRKKPPRTK
jgi:universal stress protein A